MADDDGKKEARSILEFLWMQDEEHNAHSNDSGKPSHKRKGGKGVGNKGSIKYPEEKNPVWVTREGNRIFVTDMTNNHIESVLGVFDRYSMDNQDSVREWKKVLHAELKKRGLE